MTTPAKIVPWMMEAAKQIDEIYIRANSIRLQEGIAPIISAHAPKQEWEAKEKALLTYAHELDDAGYSGEMIRRILNEGVKP